MSRLLIVAGSARKESVNRKLAQVAAKVAEGKGAEVELIDPREHVLPLYDGDLEEAEGLPAVAKQLKKKFIEADAVVFCSPEYNSSITPLMKNLIDWVSRAETEDEAPLIAYQGKVAGLLAASPGGLGGMRGLVHLRSILGNIGMLVVPRQFALGGAFDKFDANGDLGDEGALKGVTKVIEQVIEVADGLKGN